MILNGCNTTEALLLCGICYMVLIYFMQTGVTQKTLMAFNITKNSQLEQTVLHMAKGLLQEGGAWYDHPVRQQIQIINKQPVPHNPFALQLQNDVTQFLANSVLKTTDPKRLGQQDRRKQILTMVKTGMDTKIPTTNGQGTRPLYTVKEAVMTLVNLFPEIKKVLVQGQGPQRYRALHNTLTVSGHVKALYELPVKRSSKAPPKL
jgi:hypothetical protein